MRTSPLRAYFVLGRFIGLRLRLVVAGPESKAKAAKRLTGKTAATSTCIHHLRSCKIDNERVRKGLEGPNRPLGLADRRGANQSTLHHKPLTMHTDFDVGAPCSGGHLRLRSRHSPAKP